MELNKEIEYKLLLTKEEYENIILNYKHITPYIQINYYLTSNTLRKRKYGLRVRYKNNTYEMTLKIPNDIGVDEYNLNISKDDFNNIKNNHLPINDITSLLISLNIDINDIKQDLSLETLRYDIPMKYGMLSIDKNSYLNTIDYELEFEVNDIDNGKNEFNDILNKYHLSYKSNCDSKLKRALKLK